MAVQTDCGVLVFTPHSRSDPDDDSNSIPFPKNFKGIGILPTLTTEGSLESRAQVGIEPFLSRGKGKGLDSGGQCNKLKGL